jgi:hypothetical protein
MTKTPLAHNRNPVYTFLENNSKEMKMKKNFGLTGLISIVLITVMVLAACILGDEGDSGLSVDVPQISDLPDPPANSSYVSLATEAKALLTAISSSPMLSTISTAVSSAIQDAMTGSDTNQRWEVKNEEDNGLKINGSGTYTVDANAAFDEEDYEAKKGDHAVITQKEGWSIEFTADKVVGALTVYTGSTNEQKTDSYMEQTITALEPVTVRYSYTEQSAISAGLTVLHSGQAGKIILDAKYSVSASGTMIEGDGNPSPIPVVSGSLKVYGADNKVVYEKDIVTPADYQEVMGYFGANSSGNNY